MTDAISVGPDVNAVLRGEDQPAQIAESNFGDEGEGMVPVERPDAPAEETPELIAGKFKSQEDLIKAYKALEGKLGQPKPEGAQAAEAEGEAEGSNPPKMGEGEAEGETPEGEAEGEGSEDKGDDAPALDFEAFGNELAENGSLSDASYETLSKSGISREIADQYIEGFQAIQTLRGQQLYQAAGGESEFKSLVEWGGKNLPQEQQDAFNSAIDRAIIEGDFTSASMMVQAVKAQMGTGEPQLLNATTGESSDSGVKPFASRTEMAEAMRDPAYRNDPAYVAQVQQRLAVSNF